MSDQTPLRRKPVSKKAALIIVVVLFLPFILMVSSVSAVLVDRNAELKSYSHCEVQEKRWTSKKYLVTTTCGEFETAKSRYRTLSVGTVYDLKATPGNWARTQRIMEATQIESLDHGDKIDQ